jgi:hypothetical protein
MVYILPVFGPEMPGSLSRDGGAVLLATVSLPTLRSFYPRQLSFHAPGRPGVPANPPTGPLAYALAESQLPDDPQAANRG